ncbi:hypothetical protein NLG97_g3124 [Lecanicillium saksenae]|uniref:Uncharacterized protein n=1 Tax=Lecanicillium saksenae TaxID=468837 RepID=A0ACC1QYX4_9HYPO|nr:hypothetical protein NLG97_g3124 [Lecanicillium saksenae]
MFRRHTVPRISGLFEQNFWATQIVQAAGIYPATWHATLAAAAMQHWKSVNSPFGHIDNPMSYSAGTDYYNFAFCHYTHAITELVAISQNPTRIYQDQEAILSAEMLFVCMNSMAGYLKQASQHAKNIIKLHDWWNFARKDFVLGTSSSSCSSPQGAVLRKQSLVAFVSNLKVQFVNRLGYDFMVTEKRDDTPHRQLLCPATPQWTVDDAYHEMLQVLLEHLLSSKKNEIMQIGILPSRPANFLAGENLVAWDRKFQRFSQTYLDLSQMNAQNRFGWTMLEIYRRILCVSLAHDGASNNMPSWFKWDQQTSEFFQILEDLERLAEDWITQCRTIEEQKANAEFSFSMSMAESCYFISIACRDHDLRCRACALLKRWGVCDGMWDSKLMAAVIEATMDVEEEAGLANMLRIPGEEQICSCTYRQYICEDHRIWTRRIQFMSVGEAAFYYSTVAGSKTAEEMQMKFLTY